MTALNIKHLWHTIKYSRALTKCVVARKNDPNLELHVHSWRWSQKVREVWYVPEYEDWRGWRKALEVPEDKIYKVMTATSHEHAMAIIREGDRS